MTLAVTNAPKLVGDKTRQLAQIESALSLSEIFINDLFNLTIKKTGEIPEENKQIVKSQSSTST